MDGDDQTRIEDNYRGNYARLAAIKAKYDPATSSTSTRTSSRQADTSPNLPFPRPPWNGPLLLPPIAKAGAQSASPKLRAMNTATDAPNPFGSRVSRAVLQRRAALGGNPCRDA